VSDALVGSNVQDYRPIITNDTLPAHRRDLRSNVPRLVIRRQLEHLPGDFQVGVVGYDQAQLRTEDGVESFEPLAELRIAQ
jgi:hypothetical protein